MPRDSRLPYHQAEAVTRLRGAGLPAGDIAKRLGLDETVVVRSLRRRRAGGFLGLAAIIGFFAAIIATPFVNDEHLEGELVTDPSRIAASLAGDWKGYWLSRGHKRPLLLRFWPAGENRWSVTGTATDELCAGNGGYTGSGSVSRDGVTADLASAHPDCGEITVRYSMAEAESGTVQMKGRFLRMPTGDTGDHFVTRHGNKNPSRR